MPCPDSRSFEVLLCLPVVFLTAISFSEPESAWTKRAENKYVCFILSFCFDFLVGKNFFEKNPGKLHPSCTHQLLCSRASRKGSLSSWCNWKCVFFLSFFFELIFYRLGRFTTTNVMMISLNPLLALAFLIL
jgi:hypothetical protein